MTSRMRARRGYPQPSSLVVARLQRLHSIRCCIRINRKILLICAKDSASGTHRGTMISVAGVVSQSVNIVNQSYSFYHIPKLADSSASALVFGPMTVRSSDVLRVDSAHFGGATAVSTSQTTSTPMVLYHQSLPSHLPL